jgi:eukaryotic-like serine/threonine-protein kinase
MAAEVNDLPRRFGRYALFDFIGKGGMAEIFLARAETELGATRLCVVKEILPHLANDAEFADMLIFEAKLAARLSHANIVQVFDLGRAEDRLYIAMEYVEGYDLNALLRECTKRKVAMPLEFAVHIVMEALRGLDYAHRREDDAGHRLGIVHRDVSPSNLLVSLEGEVKVCDFGIAHANDLVQKPDAKVDEAIKGKAGYMSPEHARGEALDARADVFAAGIVLWELLAGRRMYKTGGDVSLLEQARRAEIPELPKRGVAGEEHLHAIVAKALAKDKTDRFESAAGMLRELEGWFDEQRLLASSIKFGEWLVSSFGTVTVDDRRAREQVLTPSGHVAIAKDLSRGVAPIVVRDLPTEETTLPLPRETKAAEPPPVEVTAPMPSAPASPPKPRKAPLVGAMIPSPGAMRAFKELARAEPKSPMDAPEPQVEIVGAPTESGVTVAEPAAPSRAWIFIAIGVLALLAAGYFALKQ